MKIHIDGKEIRADANQTILELARANGIRIPSLCDHPQLKPFSGCRLCLVQVEGRKGFVPSCSTYPEEGMIIVTSNPRLRRLRAGILELILSEHPSACLICSEKDQCDEKKATIRKVGETTGCVLCPNNGRCELQEVVEMIKPDRVRYPFMYRDSEIKIRNPFFEQNDNLCILCGRCVRVCREIRGNSVIDFSSRGSETMVGTALDRPLLESGCRFCGACVDVCPTGALTEKAVKYDAPPNEATPLLCGLCGIGCRMEATLLDGKWLGVKPDGDGPVNRGQACVKGRFMIRDTIDSDRRILQPMIRRGKELAPVEWNEALAFTADRLSSHKARESAVVGSFQLSCEDAFALRRFAADALKTRWIGFPQEGSPFDGYRDLGRRLKGYPRLNFRLDEIAGAEAVVLLAGELVDSHPIVWLRVLEAVRRGAELIVIDAAKRSFHRYAGAHLAAVPGTEPVVLSALARLLIGKRVKGKEGFAAYRKRVESIDPEQAALKTGVSESELHEAATILRSKRPILIFGSDLTRGRMGRESLTALWNLAQLTRGRLVPLASESNTRGGFEIEGRNAGGIRSAARILRGVTEGEIRALYVVGAALRAKTARAADFLVVQDAFWSEAAEKADVVLPAAPFAESEGVFVNLEGRAQLSNPLRSPKGDSKPDWWIISKLAARMGAAGFDYRRASDLFQELRRSVPAFAPVSRTALKRGREIFLKEGRPVAGRFLNPRGGEPAVEAAAAFPFRLRLLFNTDTCRGQVLSEAIRPFRMLRDSGWIHVSKIDADRLRLKNGDPVEVATPRGKLRGTARVSDVQIPGAILAAPARAPWEGDMDEAVLPAKIKRGKR